MPTSVVQAEGYFECGSMLKTVHTCPPPIMSTSDVFLTVSAAALIPASLLANRSVLADLLNSLAEVEPACQIASQHRAALVFAWLSVQYWAAGSRTRKRQEEHEMNLLTLRRNRS